MQRKVLSGNPERSLLGRRLPDVKTVKVTWCIGGHEDASLADGAKGTIAPWHAGTGGPVVGAVAQLLVQSESF